MMIEGGIDNGLRRQAITSLRKRSDFRIHLRVYVAVNALLIVVWALTGGPFWPVFPILGWGIGVGFHAWDTYRRAQPSEDAVQREIARLRERGQA